MNRQSTCPLLLKKIILFIPRSGGTRVHRFGRKDRNFSDFFRFRWTPGYEFRSGKFVISVSNSKIWKSNFGQKNEIRNNKNEMVNPEFDTIRDQQEWYRVEIPYYYKPVLASLIETCGLWDWEQQRMRSKRPAACSSSRPPLASKSAGHRSDSARVSFWKIKCRSIWDSEAALLFWTSDAGESWKRPLVTSQDAGRRQRILEEQGSAVRRHPQRPLGFGRWKSLL